MNLYLAGIYTSNFHLLSSLFARLDDTEKQARLGIAHYLESYHYIGKQSYVDHIRRDGVKVFLDSGAFSAFTKGVEVDIRAYCDYIKRNEDIIVKDGDALCASVLDGIGDAQLTYENQCTMESLGVRPLPCFHYGEDERYLEYYIANYEYITLGGMVPVPNKKLVYWLDRVWDKHLTDGAGRPRVKVHGFGMTAVDIMVKYPWYSVDSSSWVQIAANGNIFIPGYGTLAVSNTSPAAKDYGRHIDTFDPIVRQKCLEIIKGTGFDVERLQTEYVSRWTFNCWAFGQLNTMVKDTSESTYKAIQPTLF